MESQITQENCRSEHILLRNNDDGSIYVYLQINRLVGLQRIFQTDPSLLSQTFQCLTGNVLEHSQRAREEISSETHE